LNISQIFKDFGLYPPGLSPVRSSTTVLVSARFLLHELPVALKELYHQYGFT